MCQTFMCLGKRLCVCKVVCLCLVPFYLFPKIRQVFAKASEQVHKYVSKVLTNVLSYTTYHNTIGGNRVGYKGTTYGRRCNRMSPYYIWEMFTYLQIKKLLTQLPGFCRTISYQLFIDSSNTKNKRPSRVPWCTPTFGKL